MWRTCQVLIVVNFIVVNFIVINSRTHAQCYSLFLAPVVFVFVSLAVNPV